MQIPHSPRARRRGAAAVEAAFVLGVFMLLFIGLVEYCRFLWVCQICENAAREGARYAIANQGDATTVNVQNRVWTPLGGVGGQMRNHSNISNPFQMNTTSTSDIRVYRSDSNGNPQGINLSTGVTTSYTPDTWYQADWTQANFGDYIAVQIIGQYQPIMGKLLFMPDTINLKFTSVMRCEANQ
jgi:Flp pilus assembly protein TadG